MTKTGLVAHTRETRGKAGMHPDHASQETFGWSTLLVQMGRVRAEKDQEPLCILTVHGNHHKHKGGLPCSPEFWSRLPHGLSPPGFLATSEVLLALCSGEQSL